MSNKINVKFIKHKKEVNKIIKIKNHKYQITIQ